MAHIRKIEINQRYNGKLAFHYEILRTGTRIGPDRTRKKKYKQETFPTKPEAEDRQRPWRAAPGSGSCGRR